MAPKTTREWKLNSLSVADAVHTQPELLPVPLIALSELESLRIHDPDFIMSKLGIFVPRSRIYCRIIEGHERPEFKNTDEDGLKEIMRHIQGPFLICDYDRKNRYRLKLRDKQKYPTFPEIKLIAVNGSGFPTILTKTEFNSRHGACFLFYKLTHRFLTDAGPTYDGFHRIDFGNIPEYRRGKGSRVRPDARDTMPLLRKKMNFSYTLESECAYDPHLKIPPTYRYQFNFPILEIRPDKP